MILCVYVPLLLVDNAVMRLCTCEHIFFPIGCCCFGEDQSTMQRVGQQQNSVWNVQWWLLTCGVSGSRWKVAADKYTGGCRYQYMSFALGPQFLYGGS
jgi:hypothetical protein|mmetsp:Transcript_46758/g.78507  ORF Transcript_46758/g.78507 Transcript_46758/m.78507 type:complete len:98 (-) Transcript_46758:193-486(-)